MVATIIFWIQLVGLLYDLDGRITEEGPLNSGRRLAFTIKSQHTLSTGKVI